MTEIDMGPSVAVALHHAGGSMQPMPQDKFSLVYMASTASAKCKSVGNHGDHNCCGNEESPVAPESGNPNKFKECMFHRSTFDQLLPVSRRREQGLVVAEAVADLGHTHSKLALKPINDIDGQGGNIKILSQDCYTASLDDGTSQYGIGRRKRVKAADFDESLSGDNGQQSALETCDACEAATLVPESGGMAGTHPSDKPPSMEKHKWKNEARHPEARRRRWAQADPLLDLWKAVSASKYAASFRRPVALLEEYDGIVRQRMDLSTIRRRLENGLAYSITELHRDLMLMLANAIVYNRQGSEMFHMALKLKDHISALFKEVNSARQKQRSPSADDVKLGIRMSKSMIQFPQALFQEEFYNCTGSGSKEGMSSAKRHKEYSQKMHRSVDLPTVPFKKQRTSRRPRTCMSMEPLGLLMESASPVGIDSSSEEEVAAMLICIRSGQGFPEERDKQVKGVQLSTCKLLGDHASPARHPHCSDATALWTSEIVDQGEYQGLVPGYSSRAELSDTLLDVTAVQPTSKQSFTSLNERERRDEVTVSWTRESLGGHMTHSCTEMHTESGHDGQKHTSCEAAWKQSNLLPSTEQFPDEAICGGSIFSTGAADVEIPLLDSSLGNQTTIQQSDIGVSEPVCGAGIPLGSSQRQKLLELKNEQSMQASDVRSERNCMGLKHKWQQRWQMQSAAMLEETDICDDDHPTGSVTVGHCVQCDQSESETDQLEASVGWC